MATDDLSRTSSGGFVDHPKGKSGDADSGLSRLEHRHAERSAGSRRRIRVLPAEKLQCPAGSDACSALDVAAFLALVPKPMSWLKLQDLLYFGQAWHLVWDNELLFPEPILAIPDGVQVGNLAEQLQGKFEITSRDVRKGRPDRLDDSRKRTISGIVKHYGDRSHYRLSQTIMQDVPWLRARGDCGDNAIDPILLHRHYRNQQ